MWEQRHTCIETPLPVFDLLPAARNAIEAFFFTALEIEITERSLAKQPNNREETSILYAAIRQRRHPKLRLITTIFQSLGDSRFPRLLDEGQVDNGAGVGVVIDEFPLIRASTPGNLAQKAFASLA